MAAINENYTTPAADPIEPVDTVDPGDLGKDEGLDVAYNRTRTCAGLPPISQQLFKGMPKWGYGLVAILVIFVVMTFIIYFEEIHFIMKNFKKKSRRRATIWTLGCIPVFSMSGFMGAIVPRSGPLVDLVANSFFGTCLYQLLYLMVDYMGGTKRMWDIVGKDRWLKVNTPPCCCCCVCLPKVHFTESKFMRWAIIVLQVSFVRPTLMFLAAVLWTNNSYLPGMMTSRNAYTYITFLNLASTLPATYALFLLQNALEQDLQETFQTKGKIFCVQLTMLMTIVPNIIISFLVSGGKITCTGLYPSKARGETIYHGVLVIIMLPLSLLAQRFYRRASDGIQVAKHPEKEGQEGQVQEVMTIDEGGPKAVVTFVREPSGKRENEVEGSGPGSGDRVVVDSNGELEVSKHVTHFTHL